jgi:hypothetical protein
MQREKKGSLGAEANAIRSAFNFGSAMMESELNEICVCDVKGFDVKLGRV